MDRNEMIDAFVKESQAHLDSIVSDLRELRETGPEDPYILGNVCRNIRTVKGASRFFQFQNIPELSSRMETLASRVLSGEIKGSRGLLDVLYDAAAGLSNLLDHIHTSDRIDIRPETALFDVYLNGDGQAASLVRVHEKSDPGRAFEIEEEKLAFLVKNNSALFVLRLALNRDLTQKGKTPFDLVNAINSRGELIESSLDIDGIQGLGDCLDSDLVFSVFFAAPGDAGNIPEELGIARENLGEIDMAGARRRYAPNRDVLFLDPGADLVASRIEMIRDAFLKEIKENPGASKVVLKADHVDIVDSLGVNLIIGIFRQVDAESKTFEITGANEKFMKVATFFRFPSLFSINGQGAEK